MTHLAVVLRAALAGGSLVALPLAFVGGLVAGFNPCCMPLYPAAAATCCARCEETQAPVVKRAGAFVLGVALSTAALGVIAALAGKAMTGLGGWVSYVIAVVPLVMGMWILGWLKMPRLFRVPALRPTGVLGALVAGLLMSLVFAPCATPILASVLSYAAYKGSVPYGAALLLVYGIGAGIPILLVGTAAGGLAARLEARGWRPWVDRAAGTLLLGMGFYLLVVA